MKNELISVRKFPALTICNENYLEKRFSNDKKFFDLIILKSRQNISDNQKITWNKNVDSIELANYTRNYFPINILIKLKNNDLNKYKEILEFIMNYYEFGKNYKSFAKYSTTLDEMKFFLNHYNCFVKLIKLSIVVK